MNVRIITHIDIKKNGMALCELAFSNGSDLVAKEMEFGQGWNSPSHKV